MRKLLSVVLCAVIIALSGLSAFAAEPPQSWNIKSEVAVLINAQNGQVLFNKNKDAKMYPASITKILTGMLALQNGKLEENITISYNAVHSLPRGTSHIALDTGEVITLEQALYGMAIESANDAANGIAEHIGGSTEQFAFLMNDYAAQLGAVNTHFVNPHGLPDPEHYTTAQDMATITAAAIKIPKFSEIFNTRRYEIPPTNIKDETRKFNNANYFLNNQIVYDGVLMSKTGWTDESGHTLVTAVERDGITLIAVVMNSTKKIDPYDDTVALLDYGFSGFANTPVDTQGLLGTLPTDFTLEDGSVVSVEKDNVLVDNIMALLPIGADLSGISLDYGQASLKNNGRTANIPVTVNLTQGESVMKLGSSEITAIVREPIAAQIPATGQSKLVVIAKRIFFILINIVIGLLVLFIIWLAIRQMIIYAVRRRRRYLRQQKQKLRWQNVNIGNSGTRTPPQRQRLTQADRQLQQAQRLRSQIYKG